MKKIISDEQLAALRKKRDAQDKAKQDLAAKIKEKVEAGEGLAVNSISDLAE